MSFSIEKAIFINRAPFDHLEIDFKDKGINILSAINGKGKTTIISHIVDAFYEMARPYYSESFKGNEHKYYRVSSSIFNNDTSKYSIVYFRFKNNSNIIDYIDCRGNNLDEESFNKEISLENHIPFNQIKNILKENNNVKSFSKQLNKEITFSIFNNNVLTYFPSYRYESPHYLNDPYRVNIPFNMIPKVVGILNNPIEVISGLPDLASWIMDVVLDWEVYKETVDQKLPNGNTETIDITPELKLFKNLNLILSSTLSSKKYPGIVRFGIGKRTNSGQRISIMHDKGKNNLEKITPNIFCLSSGEAALLCLFGEILRQADNIKSNIEMSAISGIVLIDEVDKHLHITLQKEILPKLFELFPNIQFIVSSHSPFLNMGLADIAMDRSRIIDLDNNGIICFPKNTRIYNEVYEMMINENQQYAYKYNDLLSKIKDKHKPIIITEGKTDYRHIKNAIKVLNRTDIDIDFLEIPNDWGDSKLQTMLENLSKLKQKNIVIGIFDRDSKKFLEYLDVDNQQYKTYGNSNVYAFAIPLVNEDLYGESISIEHYYKEKDLLKEEETTKRRLFLGSEFYKSGNSKNGYYQTKISNIEHKVKINGIIDDKVFLHDDLEQNKNISLSKNAFTQLVEENEQFNKDIDFSDFNKIIDIIAKIAQKGIK